MTETATAPVLHAAALGFELDAEHGVFHLLSPTTSARVASSLECAVNLGNGVVSSAGSSAIWRPLPEEDGEGLEIQFRGEEEVHLVLRVRVDEIAGGLEFTLLVTNHGKLLSLLEAYLLSTGVQGVLDFCPQFSEALFFRNDWHSWEPAYSVEAAGPGVDPTRLNSYLAGGVVNKSTGEGLVMGFTGASHHFSRIELRPRGEKTCLGAAAEGAGAALGPGETFLSETLWVGFGSQPSLLLLDYANLQRVGKDPQPPPAAWDSWFTSFEDSNEKEILAALDAVEAQLPEVDTFIVGDGYQPIHFDGPGIGDWVNSNSSFPHGLEWLSHQIRRRGLRPGIWTAPFLVGEKSEFYRYYPNAILRTREADQPDWWEMWRGDRAYYLDATDTDARHFIREIFENLSYRCGFSFFQVDFAYAPAMDGVRSDASSTPAQSLDRGLQLIRKTIGDERYLLLSGAPVIAGSPWVDAIRMTRDAGPQWRGHCSALAAVRSILTRSFLGWGQPSVASAPLLLQGDKLTDEEFQLLVTASGLAGGPISLGGSLESLSASRRNILKQIIPGHTRTAVALDLFQRRIPQLLGLPVHHPQEDWWIIGVFNTSDEAASRRVEFSQLGWTTGDFHVYENWSQRYLGVHEGGITLEEIPAHSCRLLAIHPNLRQPQFVSMDENVLQGANTVRRTHWEPGKSGGRLTVELARHGSVTVHVRLVTPEGHLARSVNVRNGRARIDRQQSSGRLLSVEVSFRDQCSFELNF